MIEQAIAVIRATGAVTGTPNLLMMLAGAYVKVGRAGDGLDRLAEAAQIIERPMNDTARPSYIVCEAICWMPQAIYPGPSELSSGSLDSEAARRKTVRITRLDRLGAPHVQTRQARRSPRSSRADLQLVHRRIWCA